MARIKRVALITVAVVAGLGLFVMIEILSYHDEPLVIDNGPIVVSRRIGANGDLPPKPEDKPQSKRWSMEHSSRLGLLHVKAWRGNSSLLLERPMSLSGIGDIHFDLVPSDGAMPARGVLTVRRDQFLEEWPGDQQIRVDPGDYELMLSEAAPYVLNLSDQNLRIAQIRTQTRTVCLRDQHQPKEGGCTSGAFNLDRVEIQVCTKPDFPWEQEKPCPVWRR